MNDVLTKLSTKGVQLREVVGLIVIIALIGGWFLNYAFNVPRDTARLSSELTSLKEDMTMKFTSLEGRLIGLQNTLSNINTRLDGIVTEHGRLASKLSDVEKELFTTNKLADNALAKTEFYLWRLNLKESNPRLTTPPVQTE